MLDNHEETIAVDLDGTLAHYIKWEGPEHIGEPIQPMLDRVLLWLKDNRKVVIFTARAAEEENIPYVKEWCIKHIGLELPVTNIKDPSMVEFWDDRAVQVQKNTGKVLSGETTMESSLVLRYNQVSVEGIGFGVSKLSSAVAKNLNSFLSGIVDFVGEKSNYFSGPLQFDFSSNKQVDKLLQASNYISISIIEVYVPPGMNSPMVDFLESLNGTQSILNDLSEKILTPVKDYFSKLLGTPETMSSIIHNDIVKLLETYESDLQKEMNNTSACYSKHSARNKRPHGSVFKRNTEWNTSCELLTNLNQSFMKYPPSTIADQVNDICMVLDRLSIRMKQSPDVYSPTGIVSNDISDVAMITGKLVEAYAAYSFILQSANACMKDNVNLYKQVLSN